MQTRFLAEGEIILSCCDVRLGNCLPMFRRNVPLLFLELWVHELTHNLLYVGGTFVRNWGRNYPTTGRNNPEDITVLLYLKSKGKGNIFQYYVGTLNSKNSAVFTVGSLSFSNITARPGETERHILRMYSHVVIVDRKSTRLNSSH